MNLRTICLIAAFLPLQSFAHKGDFSFKVGDSINEIPSSCVESLEYKAEDEVDSESIHLSLTLECGKLLKQTTRKNIGETATILYRDNALSSAMIVSPLGANFRISSKDIPRVVLMQILTDYDVEMTGKNEKK